MPLTLAASGKDRLMHVLVTGSSGFVGSSLVPALLERGFEVTGVDRHPGKAVSGRSGYRFVEADTSREGQWQEALKDADAVVNLAGVNIFRRWTEETKKAIYESRIQTTRNVVAAMSGDRAPVLVNTSAVGFYGPRGDEALDESGAAGDDFLARLAVDWEQEARQAENKGARVVLARFGIILEKSGGALASMLPAFRMFVGGPLGSGRQWFSWIHLKDLVAAHIFVIENPEISGPVNFTSPEPVRNRDLARTLGQILGRPALFKVPGFAMRMAVGELADVLVKGQRVYPAKLEEAGFSFSYPKLDKALRASLQGP